MISNKPCKYEKIVEMWIQALFYSLVLTLLLKVIGVNFEWGRTDILKSVLLITYDRFWYFTAYFCSFFVAPFINQFVLEISEKKAKIYFIVFLSLFGIIGFIADTFKTEEGYSAFWLIILYYIGAFAKQGKVFEKKKTYVLALLGGINTFITYGIYILYGNGKLISYISPTIIMNGLLMVILFSRIRLKGRRVSIMVSYISRMAFGIYLFQMNPIIWSQILNGTFSFVVQKNICIGIIYVLGLALMIFVSGLSIECLRSALAKIMQIQIFSMKIVNMMKEGLDKIISILA